jgi:hypothetical protein
MSKIVPSTKPRKFEFIGDFKDDSIVIGNYGDATVVAKGNFNLSGLIYCGKSTVELQVDGDGSIAFKGVCKKLLIRKVRGNCILDLSDLTCQTIWCESVKGQAVITLGPTRTIELISVADDAVVRYEGKPLILNYSIRGNARIECWSREALKSA